MNDDPLEPSAEWRARMDQTQAAARELADNLRAMVEQLTADGWTDEQARMIVFVVIMRGPTS